MSNSEVKIFSNSEFGEVRTIVIDGEAWFVGKDVATILGYERATKTVVDHVDEDDRKMVDKETQSHFGIELGQRGGWLINESGLYSLVLSSKLPSAKKFKKWVTSEVLPSIRKHGAYMTEDVLQKALASPDFLIQLATQLKNEQEARKVAEEEAKKQLDKNKVLNNENQLLSKDVLTWADRPLINSLVRAYGKAIGDYQSAWGTYKRELLYQYGININSRITNYMNATGKKPKTLDMIAETELQDAISTAAAICRKNDVYIDDLLNK